MTEELIGLFDTHAHPTDERFNEDREQMLARMREAVVQTVDFTKPSPLW